MTRDAHDLGLEHDLRTLATLRSRRQALKWVLGTGVTTLVGCGSDAAGNANSPGGGGSGGTGAAGSNGSADCSSIPEETAGPYPGDGSNGVNALVLSGIVRSDLRSSIAGATAMAEGVPLRVRLTLVDRASGCEPIAGYAVYLWQCDRDGNYSMYSTAVVNQNYLRGVQQTDNDGMVEFVTIFPGCYAGRWPHLHFEIYPSLAAAVSTGSRNSGVSAWPCGL